MNRRGRDLKIPLHVGLSRRPPIERGVVVDESEVLPPAWCEVSFHSEFSGERPVEDKGHEGVELGGGLDLQALQLASPCLDSADSILPF